MRFGRARGLRERDLYFGHALRNTLIPVITIAGLQIGSLIAFAIVTETVFQWPGVGLLFISSIQGVDVPLIAAYLMFIARSEEHTSELQSPCNLVCRLLLEKKKTTTSPIRPRSIRTPSIAAYCTLISPATAC